MFHFCDERTVNRMSDASILQVAVSLFGLMQILFIQKSIDPKQYVNLSYSLFCLGIARLFNRGQVFPLSSRFHGVVCG